MNDNKLMLDVGQANELKLAFRREGPWTNELIKTLSNRKGLLTQVLDVLEGKAEIVPLSGKELSAPILPDGVVILTIDYGMNLGQMIGSGRFNWSNPKINSKRFPIKGAGKVEVEAKLFCFDRDISSKDAIVQIKAQGWEVAEIEHLLSYGAKYPEKQRNYSITALGSTTRVWGFRQAPIIEKDDLNLIQLSGNWWAEWGSRFLAVRKKSQPPTS